MKSIQYFIITLFCTVLCACSDDDTPAGNKSPFVMSASPVQGLPNQIVRIHGRNFSGIRENNEVMFNDKPAVVLEADRNELQVVVPAGEGEVEVHVKVSGQEAQGTVPAFTYLELTDYIASTLAGAGTVGLQDGTGTDVLFRSPEGLAFHPDGTIIVTDRGNHSIRRVTTDGVVTTIAGDVAGGYADGDVSVAKFKGPWKPCVDKDGNIYIADRDNHSIRKIDTDGLVSTVAGSGVAGYADGPGATAQFNQPIDVAVDDNGVLYVADNINHKIRKITPEGEVSTVAGGDAGFSNGGVATALFRNPSGVAVDAQGNVYVADRLNHRIRKIDIAAGTVSTVAGAGSAGARDGAALEAQLNGPYGVDVDEHGTIAFADLGNSKIRLVKDGKVITIAGSTTGHQDGAGIVSKFSSPSDVVIRDGVIYVADLNNHRIRMVYIK